MKKFFKSLASYSWGVLMFAVLFLAAGICLISFPEDALPKAVLTISIITIVYGVVEVILALTDKERKAKFFFSLLGAAVALFSGIFLLIKRNDDAVALLALFIGVIVMIDGSFKLHTAIMSKQVKNAAWWIVLVLAVLTVAGGLFLIKWPPASVKVCSVIMGIIMILDAIQNVFITFYVPAVERKHKKSILAEASANAEPIENAEVAIENTEVEADREEVEAVAEKANKTEAKKRGFSLFGKRRKAEAIEPDIEPDNDNATDSVNAEPDIDMPAELGDNAADDVIETVVVKPDDENNEN